ncbi:hypothetical protein SEA_WATERT_110 [Microbacterium phage WaterT]|nr:hypothetical protein SEA_WATERT_110 [Microbacterium phage WaterT]
MSGWAEEPGGGMLAGLIADAFHRAEQRDRDSEPCGRCGGDRLQTDFTDSGRCHAPFAATPGENQ